MRFDLNRFIAKYITGRSESLFAHDIKRNRELLESRINGKSALVIGGAGTIGSSYIKALLTIGQLSRLYVVDLDENGLTELTRDLRSSVGLNIPQEFKTYPINFGDKVFDKIYSTEGPFEIVANFAAHKHVRSEKDHYSIEAMLDNNVLKAFKLLKLISKDPPEHFFCVSTDKASNPVNVMGASKKLMEKVVLAYSGMLPITTARFANVAFSNGSLPAGFLLRLQKRQPLSSPNDIQRFFVSPEESGQICMLACMLGKSGDIFFPKLDPTKDMRKFTHIGDALLRENGYEPVQCETEQEARLLAQQMNNDSRVYPVYYFSSDTSGEKPFEEFYSKDEVIDWESFNSLGVIKNENKWNLEQVELLQEQIRYLFEQPELNKPSIITFLQETVPGFRHIETGKSLDQKM